MSSYLPKDSANSSPYAEGGGLYAIGKSSSAVRFLTSIFKMKKISARPFSILLVNDTPYLRSDPC